MSNSLEIIPQIQPAPSESAQISIAAAEASARAEIEARVVVAKKFPRNEDKCRLKILHECARTSFAEIALYRKPVGKKLNEQTNKWEQQYAINFSIRFIEMALQRWGNVWSTARILTENEKSGHLRVEVLDVENIVGYSRDAIIEKLVERKNPAGRRPLGTRVNSYGDPVVLVEATADEFRNKLGAEASKLLRDNGQRLLPRDLLDECRRKIEETLALQAEQDPDAARKKILDSFASVGVDPEQLNAYLERPIEALRAPDLAELRVLYNGLKEGDFTWADVMRLKDSPAEGEGSTAGAPVPGKRNRSTQLREKILGARGEQTPSTTPGSES